ncbi:MAG: hypothetical protein ACRELB_18210 [Polyangiaceae bacterium]
MRGTRKLVRLAGLGALAIALAPACSLGAGTGTCSGTLDVPACWSGDFDLHPDFFAAIPGDSPQFPGSSVASMVIRIQHGGDYESFSDGLVILIDDAGEVRGDPAPDGTPRPSLLGQPLVVDLPPGVVPPGVPVTPVATPRIVHATLYLDSTCRTQDEALYALDSVSGVDTDGECRRPEAGTSTQQCPGPATGGDAGTADAGAGAVAEAGAPGLTGQSTITFTSLFDNNPDESNASQRLSEGSFEFYLADPRNICPGGFGPAPPCEGHLKGTFKFYFQRGRPAQPFP